MSIPMEEEFAKLVEIGKGTVYDWVFSPNFGFFAEFGRYLSDFGWYDDLKILSGGDSCKINYVDSLQDYVGIIRFPMVGVLSIMGIIIGSLGLSAFCRHSAKAAFSFAFFLTMNCSGLFFHCLLPISSKMRVICALIDHASPGVSGIFLSLEMYGILEADSILNSCDEFASFNMLHWLSFVFLTFLLSNIPLLGELIYVTGCGAVRLGSVYVLLAGKKKEAVFVATLAKCCCLLFVGLGLLLPFNASLCEYSSSTLNMSSLLFAISDIGFVFVLIHGKEYYAKRDAKSRNKKRK